MIMAKRVLILPLKKKWFEMIKSGVKRHEYRDYTKYWRRRLMYETPNGEIHTKIYDEVEFTCGYPAKDDAARRIRFDNPLILISIGFPEWGASGELQFVIMFGNRIL